MPESKQNNKLQYFTVIIAILALVCSVFSIFHTGSIGTEVGTSATTTISNLTVRNGITAGSGGLIFNSLTNATTMVGDLSVSGSCFTNTTSNLVVGKNLTAGTGGGFKFNEVTNATTLTGTLTVPTIAAVTTTGAITAGSNLLAGSGSGFSYTNATNATVLAGTLSVGAITSTGNSQVAELNITGAAVASNILCMKPLSAGIGQCSNNITADAGNVGNCTCT